MIIEDDHLKSNMHRNKHHKGGDLESGRATTQICRQLRHVRWIQKNHMWSISKYEIRNTKFVVMTVGLCIFLSSSLLGLPINFLNEGSLKPSPNKHKQNQKTFDQPNPRYQKADQIAKLWINSIKVIVLCGCLCCEWVLLGV